MKKVVPTDAILIPAQAKRVFAGVIYDVYQWPQVLFDGTKATFEMLKRPDTVEVIAVVDDKILIVHDEQPGRGSKASFPGGRVEPDEDHLLAAQRELAEETGYTFKQWRLVKVWQPVAKMEWFIYAYVAWDVASLGKPHVDAGEKITLELVPFQKAQELAFDKAGYLAEVQDLFSATSSADELLALPEFTGRVVERS